MNRILLALGALLSPVQSTVAEQLLTFSRPLMGTTFSVQCYADDRATAERLVEIAFAKAAEVNAVASDYHPTSELSLLTKKAVGVPHTISPLLFELLANARRVAELTDGAFDPTLGSLTKLWRTTCATGRMPDPHLLTAARAAAGWEKFSLNAETRTVTLHHPRMAFDLGGSAKGHAADLMWHALSQSGMRKVLITAGGDVRLGDPPPGRVGWNVAIKTSDTAKNDAILTLANAAVSTSGDLHQVVVIAGVSYSHILDPATGLGLTQRVAATVIADQGRLSDPLATAACVLATRKNSNAAMLAIQKIPGVREVKLGRASR